MIKAFLCKLLDVDECMAWAFKCQDQFQECRNTYGSYKCVCEEGLYWIDNQCKGEAGKEISTVHKCLIEKGCRVKRCNTMGIREDGTGKLKCLSRLQRSGRFRVTKNFAFVFCGRKAFGGNIIKPDYLILFFPFPFCYTPKQLQPAEGRF